MAAPSRTSIREVAWNVAFWDYSGANETGTLEYQAITGPRAARRSSSSTRRAVLAEADNYSGAYGTGTLSSTDFNYTSGSSERDISSVRAQTNEFFGYSGAGKTRDRHPGI